MWLKIIGKNTPTNIKRSLNEFEKFEKFGEKFGCYCKDLYVFLL